jgi:iron complex transport system substrate-binding protein
MKKILILLLSLCITLLISGCDIEDEDDVLENGEYEHADEAPEEPQPFPIIVGGVEIIESPEKVISLSPSLTEIVFELGFGSRLIARSSYCDFPLGASALLRAGSAVNPNIDRIIELSPSLVLTTGVFSQKDMFRMEQANIGVLVVPPSTSLNELRNVYRALGLVFEGVFTGSETGDEAFSVISRVCDNIDVVSLGNFIYITGDFKVATGDTLEHSIFSCFGKNLAERGSNYEFDLSRLIENQPDVILLSDKYSAGELLASGDFNELYAVTAGRIIYIDNTVFERPSARIVPMIRQMLTDFRNV